MEKYRKTLLLLIGLILIPVTSATLQTEIVETDPSVLEQGDTATIFVRLSNQQGEIAKDIEVIATPPKGMSLIRADQRVTSIGSLGEYQDYVIPYEVSIDDGAPLGELSFTTRVSVDGSQLTRTLPLLVENPPEQVEVRSMSVEPDPLEPGAQGVLTVQLVNQGQTTARNINIVLNTDKTPIRPEGEGNIISIPRLDGEQVSSFTLPVRLPSTTSSGLYDLPLTLEYTVDKDEAREREHVGSYVVDSEPAIDVSVESEDAVVGSQGTVDFSVVNKGLSDVKRLTILLTPVNGTDSDTKEVYIGDLSADDFDIVSHDIIPAQRQITYDAEITYLTTRNEDRSQTKRLTVNARESETSYTVPVVALLLLLGGIVYWWRRRG